MTKSQVFFWLLVSFIAGVAVASYLPLNLTVVAAVFMFGGSVAAFGLLRLPERGSAAVAGFLAMAAAFGMFWFLRSSRPPASSLAAAAGERIATTGMVDDDPVRTAQSQRLVVRRDAGGERILVVSRPFPAYAYGDRVAITGRLERPERFSPAFDYAAYLAKDDIFYTMRFPKVELIGRGYGSPAYRLLFTLKHRFADHLASVLPEPHAAFMAGLTIGERQSFPASLTEELRKTGTSHLVALSGYNITIVADALLAGLTAAFVPFNAAFWLAATGIVGFVMFTGAPASVVRAAIMGLLVLVARRVGRISRMRNALALAAAAMLIANPRILRFDVGFQLSFLATLGLIYLSPQLERAYERVTLRLSAPFRDFGLIRISRDPRDLRRAPRRPLLAATLLTTLSAQLAVLPLLVWRFGMLSLVSPVANLAVVPFIPMTMFFGFLTGATGFASDLAARIAAAPAWALLSYELSAIAFFSRIPVAAFAIRGVGFIVFVGLYLLFGLFYWRALRSRRASNI